MAKSGQPILFISYCWGGAGTTWLAWALNSHKHILCLHAANFPRFNRHNRKDTFAIVKAFHSLKALGNGYCCVGFTHGIRREWHSEFVKEYGEHFRACILTRHPIKRINSLTALKMEVTKERRLSIKEWFARNRSYNKLVKAAGQQDFPKDSASLSFYHACHAMNRIDSEVATGLPIYRFEDMVGTVDGFRDFLSYISNGNLTMSAESIQDLQGTIKGKHAPKSLSVQEIYVGWTEIQKRAFRALVKPSALLAYDRLGYEFPESVRPAETERIRGL